MSETPMNKLRELCEKWLEGAKYAKGQADFIAFETCARELRAILPDVERLIEALRLARKFVRGRLSYAPFGPQSLLDEIDAALALFGQPVAPKETE